MAIFFDSATGTNSVSGTTLTFAHTTAGLFRMLFVGVNGATTAEGGDIITGVTYAGVSMTLIAKHAPVITGGAGVDRWQYMFRLINPTVGTNNVVVSRSGAGGYMEGMASSYKGVRQVAPYTSNTAVSSSSVTSWSNSVTAVEPVSWLVGYSRAAGGNTQAGTGTTFRAGVGTQTVMSDSGGGVNAGSRSLAYTCGSGDYISFVCAINPQNTSLASMGVG